MGRVGLLGAVAALSFFCACGREAARDITPGLPPLQAEDPAQQPPDGGASQSEGPPDAGGLPPAGEVTVLSGPCGTSERVRLGLPADGYIEYASASGRIVIMRHGFDGALILDTQTGRTTKVPGILMGLTTDERRVLFWTGGAYSDGHLLEVTVETGAVRVLFPEPVPWPLQEPGLGALVASTASGGQWLYDLDSATVTRLAEPDGKQPLLAVSGEARRVLSRDRGELSLWELASGRRWRIGPAEAAHLLPGGSGVVYLDAQSRAWGWTPEGGAVSLGPRLGFSRPKPASNGAALFLHDGGGATLWNVRTSEVWTSGPDVVGGFLSASGTRLGLVLRAPDGTFAVTVQDLAAGTERTFWRGPGQPFVRLDGTGSRLAIAQRVPDSREPHDWDYTFTLWDVDSGAQLPLSPPVRTGRNSQLWMEFRDEGRLLFLRVMNEYDALYSVDDGTLRYSTRRTVAPGEGHFSYWGAGDVFYGQQGAHHGPPDGGLFAWNPRTGVETELGRGTQAVCFIGDRHLFRRGLKVGEGGGDPGALLAWHPDTGALDELASAAVRPSCLPESSRVLFLDRWTVPDWTGMGTPPAGSGDLVSVDLEKGCRQTLGTGVQGYHPLRDSILFKTADALWQVSYPKPAPAP